MAEQENIEIDNLTSSANALIHSGSFGARTCRKLHAVLETLGKYPPYDAHPFRL